MKSEIRSFQEFVLYVPVRLQCVTLAGKIRCSPVHPLYGALPVLHVPVQVTRGALVENRYTSALHRCKSSQYRRLLFSSQCLCEMIWLTLYSMVWDWRISIAGSMLSYWLQILAPSLFLLFSLSLLSFYRLVLWSSDWSYW